MRVKKMATAIAAGTLALTGLGVAGATSASANLPGGDGTCGVNAYTSGGGWGDYYVRMTVNYNNCGFRVQAYAKCKYGNDYSDGSVISGTGDISVFPWCANGFAYWGYEVYDPYTGTWQSYQLS